MALAAVLLSGCSATVPGQGRGNAPAASSRPVPSASSSAPAPSFLDRVPVHTAIGDPVIADLCKGQELDYMHGLGYIEYRDVQFGAQCDFRVALRGRPQVGISEYMNPARVAPAERGGHSTTVLGLPVYLRERDARDGECSRDVRAGHLVVTIDAFALGVSNTSAKVCAAADATVRRLAMAVDAHTRFPHVNRARRSVFALDMCNVAMVAGLDRLAPFEDSDLLRTDYGAECQISSVNLTAYVDVALDGSSADLPDGRTPVRAGSHRLLASSDNSRTRCDFVSPQQMAGDGSSREFIDFEIDARHPRFPPPRLCSRALAAIGTFLDAGGLH